MIRVPFCAILALVAAAPLAAQEGRKLALLVGVNVYENRKFEDLKYAERDVSELAKVLKAAGYDVRLLLGSAAGDDEATRVNVQRAIEALLDKVKKKDTLLVAMAGHGVQFRASDVGKEEAYFCPKGAILGKADTLVSLSKLLKDLDERGGRSNLVLVDACRNDPDPNRGRGIDGSRAESLPEGTAVLFSCSKGQRAYESEKAGGGHGVFFHFVLEGLSGKAANDRGEVTWNRLVTFVIEEVDAQFEKLIPGAPVQQRPHEIKNFSQNLVLLDSGRPPATAERPPDKPVAPPVAPKEPAKPANADAESYHPQRFGSRWRYRVSTGHTIETRVAGFDKVNDRLCVRLEMLVDGTVANTESLAVGDGAIRKHASGTTALDEPQVMLKLPPKDGDRWTQELTVQGFKGTCKNWVSEETVTVPAGTFRAFKVQSDLTTDGQRYQSTKWYVKGVGVVKERNVQGKMDTTMELEKYTPAK